MKFYYIFSIIFLLILLGCRDLKSNPIACDALVNYYHLLYEGQNNLNSSINIMFKERFLILKDCALLRLSERGNSNNKYGIEAFDVGISCDILEFNTTIYRKGNKLYTLREGLGPCGKENVFFRDYQNDTTFEYLIMKNNIENVDFCLKLINITGDKIPKDIDKNECRYWLSNRRSLSRNS